MRVSPNFVRVQRDRCDACHKLVATDEDCFEHERAKSIDRGFAFSNTTTDPEHDAYFARTFCTCPLMALFPVSVALCEKVV